MFEVILVCCIFLFIRFILPHIDDPQTYKKQEGDLELEKNTETNKVTSVEVVTQANGQPVVSLEDQLTRLASDGISLSDGVSIDALVYNNGRDTYEYEAYDFIFHALSDDLTDNPDDGTFSNNVWRIEHECIYADGDYCRVVQRLALLAGQTDYISDLIDRVDTQYDKSWVEYKHKGISRRYKAFTNGAYIDLEAFQTIASDFETSSHRFYFKGTAHTGFILYLSTSAAASLNRYISSPLMPLKEMVSFLTISNDAEKY